MRVFGRLMRYVLRHKGRLGLVFALALVGVLVELARPWPIKVVVDHALAGQPAPAWVAAVTSWLPGAQTAGGLIAWSVGVAVLIVLLGAVLALVVLNTVVAVAQRLVYDLSRDLFEKLQRLSLSFHSRHRVGDLLQRTGGDVFVVHHAVSQVALPAAVSLLSLAGMFAIMAHLDWTLALIALAVVPLLALALAFFTRPMNDRTTDQYRCQGSLMALAEQSLSAVKVIQGFAREDYVQRKLDGKARELGDAYARATRVSAGYNAVVAIITGTAAALLLGLGGQRVLDGRLSVGDLLVFLAYLVALYGPVNQLSLAVGYAVAVVARGRRVFEVLDSEEVVQEVPNAITLPRASGEVVFEDVAFGYGDRAQPSPRPVLRTISFRARPGEVIAVVGATGAGKTSLVSLLSRFYDPWEGRLLLDGHDLRDLSLRSLRENIALVLQEPYLFPMTVADNIAFGRPGASRAEIVTAAQIAQAHGFIERLPQGYDTVIGEKGTTLSGGERQRIAIARAVLKDAPVLILDEPTSSVDARTEAQIFEALSGLVRGRTTFIVSHRLSTIRRADQILALEDGRIVESGTHDALLRRGTVYARLYHHQHLAAT